ncbi:MAG: hypothetical protein H7Y12_12475 [Sphingobacteriaceae bacterium]|nr:hypothetical protein [Cytophagaceae bacterium]
MQTLSALITALFFSLLISFPSTAQTSDAWQSGQVELATGDWLAGELRYNSDLHLLELALDGTVQTFTPQKVASFYFFDPEVGCNRSFVRRDVSGPYGHEMPTFFEVLVEGRVQLLAREEEHRSVWLRRLIGRGSNRYFLAYADGRIVKYRGRVEQLTALLADHKPEVDFFVKRVQWYRHEEKPIAELMRFYNSLGE